jgi:TctA family transporter
MLEPPLREPLKQATFFSAVVASVVLAFLALAFFEHATKLSSEHLFVYVLAQIIINKGC